MLDIELESKRGLVEHALATRELDLGWITFAKGTVAGQRRSTVATAMDASSLNWRSAGP